MPITESLQEVLTAFNMQNQLWIFLLVVCRMVGIVYLLPGFVEFQFSSRLKVGVVFALSFIYSFHFNHTLPSNALVGSMFYFYMAKELVVGCFLGYLVHSFYAILSMVGTIVSQNINIAQAIDSTINVGSSSILAAFFSIGGINLFFTYGCFDSFLSWLYASYDLLPIQEGVSMVDLGQMSLEVFVRVFKLTIQMVSPFLIFSFLFNFALGIVNKFMPQMQVFFVAAPGVILIGLLLLVNLLPLLIKIWLNNFNAIVLL